MSRWYKIFARISFLTVVLIVMRIIGACAIWRPADDRSSTTGMFVIIKDVLIDPDSIAVDYDGEYLRRTSLSIANMNPGGMINSKSYSKLYFVEDKERDEVYFSTDGFHYEPVPFNEEDNVTTRAYRWMVAWFGPQENLLKCSYHHVP